MNHKYTLSGVAAILLWSALIGLARTVTEHFGPIGGAALIYTIASAFLILTMGLPKIGQFSRRYLFVGSILFVSYEICLALALGMANDRHQALEMAVINYLWPALTVLLAVVVSKKPTHRLVYPGIFIALFGVVWAVIGDGELTVAQLVSNVATNPATYSMAFVGAFIWAIYCNVTKRLANGQNAIVVFFILTAVTLWIKYSISDEQGMSFDVAPTLYLLLTGVVMGGGYALWNIAIIKGNMVLLASLSYFTPVLATLISSYILSVSLTSTFWQGVAMVTGGSLICWWFTRDQ
ncbi:aromatic amino acid DMT transporter YddG [Vibrio genomosp. F10]|uniref:Aromatic amino acid transporter n=1 Tax=Vibrio genomosp. F10 str. ZF-129 TaxID=1187848 RepID=A0A1E5BCX8_9VIBR|nr:aromatic amino acid DMT transporter YddG [Vibrio genomosp. F10]OEE32708.1 aromatic amino acid transporter [Vibrio genomosp. F10 str. ZF-129]OEE94358.1 aromatic amino acid transporter [Vibrio genomosp. F10 str. 9ZC157]OEF05480.1 aromatic amino acid transporter [Vibrio genomosp. F10 str. 9ZB36]